MKRLLSTTMTLASLLGFPLLANFAAADTVTHPSNFDQKSIEIEFDDLNPAIPADAKALVAKLQRGARNACVRNDEHRQLFLGDERKACIAQGFSTAVAEINRSHHVDLEAVAASYRADANLAAASR